MTHHPRGGIDTSANPARATLRGAATLVTIVLALAGCTPTPPPPAPPPNAPVLPAEQFPAFADRGDDVHTSVDAFAADGQDVVAIATATGRLSVPTFWYSPDAGATWQQGALTTPAAEATEIAEQASGLAAVRVTAEGRRWLALGSRDRTTIAWTSVDGQTWDRAPAVGIDRALSSLAGLAATPDGFVLVGSSFDQESNRRIPQAWTSPDGVTWSPQALPGHGWLSGVAVHESTVVAVGAEDLPKRDKKGRTRRPLILASTDGGASWQERDVPLPKASSGFNDYLTTVTRTPDGFIAGGSHFLHDAHTYNSWTVSSVDGATWQVGADVPRQATLTQAVEVLSTDKGLLLVESIANKDTDTVSVSAMAVGGGWTRRHTPSLKGRGWTEDAVVAGDAVLWSVGNEDADTDSRIWRTTDRGGTWTEATLPVPAGMGARVEPSALALKDGVLTAWGNAQGATSVWTRAENGTWGAPRLVRDEVREGFLGVVAGPHGWLVLGSKQGDAQVLTSPDGQTWHESGPGTFNEVAQYHYSSVSDAVWSGDRWVVVGNRSTNGNVRSSAFVASSGDGASWQEGEHSKVFQRGDSYGSEDQATDLDGLENLGREMWGIADTPGGLVAAGEVQLESGSTPVVWFPAKGETWRLQDLPFDGYTRGSAHEVLAHEGTLLVVGAGRPQGDSDWVPLAWRSTDGGASFQLSRVGDQGRTTSVHPTTDARGFVVLAGQPGGGAPLLWRSADGTSWTSTPVAVPNAADGVEAGIRDVLAEGDTLHVLMNVTNRLDSVPVVVEVPLG